MREQWKATKGEPLIARLFWTFLAFWEWLLGEESKP